MNATALAQTAYQSVSAIAPSERDVEYRVLSRVTRALSRHAGDQKADFPGLAQALHENLKLWSVFAQDVASDGNQYPPKLRAQLFYLAEFTRLHTNKVLKDGAAVDVLIDINTSIMRGLRSNPLVR